MANPNFDALLSTTLKNYIPKLEDNVFSSRAFWFWLTSKGRSKEEDGGAKIVVPLIHGLNDTAASYAGYDNLPTTPQEGISAAEYDWKQFGASIAISGIEEFSNGGEHKVIDLLKAKIMQAEETIAEKLDEDVFGDGTGNGGKDFHGLQLLVENGNTVGGINGTTYAYWNSYEENTAEALTIARMNTAFNSVSRGNDHPDGIFTTQTLFEKYESLLQPAIRYTDTKTADAGFQNLLFKTTPIMYDSYCTSGVMYFLNSKYLWLIKGRGRWMKTTDFIRPNGQDARYAQILSYGNLVVSNRSRQGKLTGKTA